MRFPVSLHILLAVVLLSPACTATYGGLSDNAADKATQAVERRANDSTLPAPTTGAWMLAAVHNRPQLLDDEFTLMRVLLTVHPEALAVVDNHQQWRKQKDELKNQLLAEARSAQLVFELQPWRDSSMTKGRPVELFEYDLQRRAFHVRFAIGNARQVITGMLMPGGGKPAPKYEQVIDWFPVEPDKAEQIINYFGNRPRKVYLHYRLEAVGALKDAPLPTPVFIFANDQLALYALDQTLQDNQMHEGYRYLATVTVPTTDAAATIPAVRKTAADYSAAATGVIQNVEIDGIRLTMPIEQALQKLAEHGLNIGPPSRPSRLTGVTYIGHETTVDGAGWIKVMVRQMNGVVYQYDKNVMYLLDRLPADITVSDLQQKYHDEFVGRVDKARYIYTDAAGTMHFDDSSPPPYNRNINSPHARVKIIEGKKGERFHAGFSIEWKTSVGANW